MTETPLKPCAYCGNLAICTADHVVPRALYPASKSASRVQRITVDACGGCNNGLSDDEAHFRNVLLVSGNPTDVVRELWDGKAHRGFRQVDGRRRVLDVAAGMVAVHTPEGERYMIYPGRDARVTRVVRKIVRGLCHHHGLPSPVPDGQVWADVQKFEIQSEFLADMSCHHVDGDVLEYRVGTLGGDPDIHSVWLFTFFTRTPFVSIVYRSAEARERVEAGTWQAALAP
jgi:hypothetical protein